MRRFIFLLNLFLLVVVTTAQAQIPEEKKFNAQIDAMLKTRQLGDVANELSRRKTTSVPELLKSIVIFARAGQKTRVRDSLVQLSSLSLPDTHPDSLYLRQIVRSAIDNNDLFSQRL